MWFAELDLNSEVSWRKLIDGVVYFRLESAYWVDRGPAVGLTWRMRCLRLALGMYVSGIPDTLICACHTAVCVETDLGSDDQSLCDISRFC